LRQDQNSTGAAADGIPISLNFVSYFLELALRKEYITENHVLYQALDRFLVGLFQFYAHIPRPEREKRWGVLLEWQKVHCQRFGAASIRHFLGSSTNGCRSDTPHFEDMFDEIMTQTLDPNNQLRGAEFVINEYVVDSDDRVVDGPFEELDDADASSEQEQQEAATVNTTSRAGRARQAPNFREMRRQGLI
jgi:hypothetical protein